MSKQDRHFINVFSMVLGILIVIALVLVAFSRRLEDKSADSRQTTDPLLQQEVIERIRPFGQVAVAGQDPAALAIAPPPAAAAEPAAAAPPPAAAAEPAAAAPPPAAAAEPAAAAPPAGGEATYNAACAVCHDAGVAGAPKLGDQAAWASRLAQGATVLHQHALQGYQGQAGYMPPKGGRADLPDDAIVAAVDYMAEAAR